MLKTIGNIFYDYYQFFMLPFLSISIFYAMEYMSRGVEFFVNEKGVKWRFLSFCALMQFFVSLVVILSVSAMFKSDALQEYQTLQLVAIILLGTTPFNISILIWVAIKLEIYRLMQNRYQGELKDLINAESFIGQALKANEADTDNKPLQDSKTSQVTSPASNLDSNMSQEGKAQAIHNNKDIPPLLNDQHNKKQTNPDF
jgi:hypothetical protein